MDSATKKQIDRYITIIKNQLRELIEEYNTFLIWFEGEWGWESVVQCWLHAGWSH